MSASNSIATLRCWLPATVAMALLLPGAVSAQSGGPYALSWSTIDGGGVSLATGGTYSLGGTTGQPDAGMISGGPYELKGGFWPSGADRASPVPNDFPDNVVHVFRLYAAWPNPFNPFTTIGFDLPRSSRVTLDIYDLRGALVRRLESANLPAGHHERIWDGRDQTGGAVASGAYVFTITAGEYRARQKGLLLK